MFLGTYVLTTMVTLTDRQLAVWNYIDGFIGDYGYSPSKADIAEHFKVSVNAVAQTLDQLKRMERVDWVSGQPRTLRALPEKESEEAETEQDDH